MYKLTLETDEHTLSGEVYEREDKKGWEFRLYYTENVGPTRIWDSISIQDGRDGVRSYMDLEKAKRDMAFYMLNKVAMKGIFS